MMPACALASGRVCSDVPLYAVVAVSQSKDFKEASATRDNRLQTDNPVSDMLGANDYKICKDGTLLH